MERKPRYITSDQQNITPLQFLRLRDGQNVLGQQPDQPGDLTHLGKAIYAGLVMLQ